MLRHLSQNIVLRLAVWYGLLGTVLVAIYDRLPRLGIVEGGAAIIADGRMAAPVAPPIDQVTLGASVALAMISAALLTLPVTWVYMATRQKRGFQQSVVHMLLMLPIVVAGIVVMVKYSLILAFALAGIVAAVRFRNTLDDSRDALYVFLSTGMGLACALDLPVAFVISVIFNIVTLILYYSDFGRTPATEGPMARRRMDKAMQAMTRTGSFVARVDREILQDMSPEQLDALSERAKRRRREMAASELGGGAEQIGRLRVRSSNVAATRPRLETWLDELLKKWELERVVENGEGIAVIEYTVRMRKNVPAADVVAGLRARIGPEVAGVELD